MSRLKALKLLLCILGIVLLGRASRLGLASPYRCNPSKEIVNERDGSLLMLVPAGPFTMGSDEENDEKPIHSAVLPAYYIGKYTVTNAQFRRFVERTGFRATLNEWEFYATRWGDSAPVVGVSWADATAYCQWAGLRLPTEAEWEKAARGTDQRRYPWGNEWQAGRCRNNVKKPLNAESRPVPVGGYPSGMSPYGIFDMAGNVAQWTDSWYEAYPGNNAQSSPRERYHVVRGGSYIDCSPIYFQTTRRITTTSEYSSPCIGFRVAKNL